MGLEFGRSNEKWNIWWGMLEKEMLGFWGRYLWLTGFRRKLPKEEHHDVCYSPYIISVIKRRVGRVADIRQKRNAKRILVQKPQGMSLLGRPWCRGQDNITCVVKTETGALGTGRFGCEQERVSDCCEHGDEQYWVAEELVGAVGGFCCVHLTQKNSSNNNKVRELVAVKLLHTSLLNTTVIAFKVLPLGSYEPMSAPSPPFETILELVLWNGLQSCRCITPDVISVIKMPSFQYFLYLWEHKKVTVG